MAFDFVIPHRFRVVGTGEILEVPVRRVLVAGFTGRDKAAVEAHVRELSELGVPAPDRVPIVVELEPSLLASAGQIDVWGSFTSGEVEPVVVRHSGRRWLTVGSDHTDRDVERESIARSKASAPKVIASDVLELDSVRDLDAVEIESHVDEEADPYQRGKLADLLAIDAIEAALAELGVTIGDGDVMFCGSIPVRGSLRPARRFAAELRDPTSDRRVFLDYVVRVAPPLEAADRKPEIEFTPAGGFDWVPVEPGVPGLTERVLARHGDTKVATRMLRFAPGTDTSAMGTLAHDFWEEVYILSGSMTDLVLGTTFSAGSYACRPPGMKHGPWVAPEGCVTFEVRYPVSGQELV